MPFAVLESRTEPPSASAAITATAIAISIAGTMVRSGHQSMKPLVMITDARNTNSV